MISGIGAQPHSGQVQRRGCPNDRAYVRGILQSVPIQAKHARLFEHLGFIPPRLSDDGQYPLRHLDIGQLVKVGVRTKELGPRQFCTRPSICLGLHREKARRDNQTED